MKWRNRNTGGLLGLEFFWEQAITGLKNRLGARLKADIPQKWFVVPIR